MSNNLTELVFSVIIVCVIVVVGLTYNTVSGYVKCNSYESITGRQTKYSFITGCYVKTDKNTWIPREEMTKTTVVESK
ncbi:hypothetical protein HYQ09_gp093 [Acinetobacter phage vB_AbaM_Konradin]|uniref:Uncharacterized protein n=6 Tax=Lazarusvirus TaxID=2842820 RepID=A0A4Y1NKZ3_9CAUD|nr:hypothetical protein HYP67_gp096 [Acinetobacter phage vB_ApiM_fHyAci03]YP_009885277.1 hypothetical protein HYQ09_gp093 [Acinetobacter phage vB_AbaM_Konradin]YP_009886123.1 hypothetical protein HYQ20_gp096 [Acinetobacter phage vB_AbaM_Berthold]YP_009886368.1 hypothetical protein HYQ21_gp091 [Acinetobacter phage vB_AbaM_Apostate]YP_009889723.1 hypothetical protein HYP65_gp092 [Acinetobacter phage AM101]QGT54106.1 hypothetical protein Stupor_093 [Acinetobacter phage Stupor]QKN88036.1 hypothet